MKPKGPHVIDPSTDTSLVLSYLAVRASLGILGLALPVALFMYSQIITDGQLQPSISDYYHTHMGDYLVGSLWAIGVFLIAYKGYARTIIEQKSGRWIDKLSDRWVSTVAGFSAISVAMFPVNPAQNGALAATGFTFHTNAVHYFAAFVFFICMALFCLVLFPRGDGTQNNVVQKDGRQMTQISWTSRNFYFVVCGGVIVAAMVALAGYFVLLQMGQVTWVDALNTWDYFFWAEVAAILAFAAAWLEKGRNLFSPLTMIRKISR